MLFILGIDSIFSLAEVLNSAIADRYPQFSTAQVSIGVCLVAFLAGIVYTSKAGIYFLDIVDHFVTSYNLLLTGLFQAILAGWIYGAERLRRYINQVSDWSIGKWWNLAIKYLIPFILVALLISQFSHDLQFSYEGYPYWAIGIGWMFVLVPLLLFLLMFVI